VKLTSLNSTDHAFVFVNDFVEPAATPLTYSVADGIFVPFTPPHIKENFILVTVILSESFALRLYLAIVKFCDHATYVCPPIPEFSVRLRLEEPIVTSPAVTVPAGVEIALSFDVYFALVNAEEPIISAL
jgi:hypothetical protein